MASGCRSYLRSSAYETGDGGWMGGGCGRKCAAEAACGDHHTIRQIHTARKGRVRGRGVGLGARIYLGVQTAADRERTARGWRRRGSAVLGLVGGRRRGLEETLAAPPWGLVGGRRGLSRGGGCATLACWIGSLVRGWRRWGEKREGRNAAGAAQIEEPGRGFFFNLFNLHSLNLLPGRGSAEGCLVSENFWIKSHIDCLIRCREGFSGTN